MTRTPLSRSKGQGHQAALLSAALTSKVAAAVSVGTYSAWESIATLRLLGGAPGAWAPTGEERDRGISCCHVHSLLFCVVVQCSRGFFLTQRHSQYNLRTGAHRIELITKTSQLNDRDFNNMHAVEKMLLNVKLCRTRPSQLFLYCAYIVNVLTV